MATNFTDASGETRLVGTIYAPGSSVGDVFTVQADGSLAAALNDPTVIGGVAINNTATGAGEVLETIDANNATWQPAGGGSLPGAQHWIGPYTVGFADFDPDTYAAEVMTPLAGDLFLGARFLMDSSFDGGVVLSVAAGDLADGPGVYIPTGGVGGVSETSAGGVSNGASPIYGPEIEVAQDGTSKLVTAVDVVGAFIAANAVNPRIFAYTNQLPTMGSASVWLCFATPEAP